jgi:parallel beta-helix repeat protein
MISENTITSNRYDGIYMYDDSNFNIISKNTITSNGNDGIYIYCSSNNTVSENSITKNYKGVFFWNCSGNTISENIIADNIYDGMCIHGAYNTIFGNAITNSGYDAIGLHGAFNTIFGNTITNSGYDGIHLYDSLYNTVFHNSFINNTYQARLSDTSSALDNGYPSGGNYWNDYTGIDEFSGLNQDELGSNGIGDTPYIVDGNNQDNYPLMAPIYSFDAGTWKGTHYFVDVVSNSTVSDFHFNPSEGPFLRFSVTGPDDTSGFCRVTVPKGLLSTPDVWTVKVSGQTVTPNIMEDGENTYLYFTYSHNIKIVEIRGEEANPEFPIWIPMLLILIVLAVAIVLYKQRLSKTPIY